MSGERNDAATGKGRPEAPEPDAKSKPRVPGQSEVDKVRQRWALASGVVGWLVTVIGPAISFDAKLALSSNSGTGFQAFFLILATVLFLLAWRSLGRLPLWALCILAALSISSFLAYDRAKDEWTCVTYMDESPLVMGTEMKPGPKAHLAKKKPPPVGCEARMEPWGGDSYQIWEEGGVRMRFLALFGLYALAWLALALLIVGAARRSLSQWRPAA